MPVVGEAPALQAIASTGISAGPGSVLLGVAGPSRLPLWSSSDRKEQPRGGRAARHKEGNEYQDADRKAGIAN